jgi:hypothetical protein
MVNNLQNELEKTKYDNENKENEIKSLLNIKDIMEK